MRGSRAANARAQASVSSVEPSSTTTHCQRGSVWRPMLRRHAPSVAPASKAGSRIETTGSTGRAPSLRCRRHAPLDAGELLAERPELRLVGMLGDHFAQHGCGAVELPHALVRRGEGDLVLDDVDALRTRGECALEGGRGLRVLAEREATARDAHRELGAQVEELVERLGVRRCRRLLETLEDGERLGGLAVPQEVPRLLEVDDVREVAVGIAAAELLEGVLRGGEAVLLEEAPRGEVLVDVAEPRLPLVGEPPEILRHVLVAARVALELVRELRVAGHRVLH